MALRLNPASVWAIGVSAVAGPGRAPPSRRISSITNGDPDSGPATALTPMAHTEAGFSLNAIGVTPTPERAAAVGVHLDRIQQRIGALATGDTCVNFLDLEGATEKRV